MRIYTLEKKQVLPIDINTAWDFFSNPANLKEITPAFMYFKITNKEPIVSMYSGQIITYIVKPLFGIPIRWVTEIKHVKKHEMFVDEQRFGPYKLWHHKHFFKEVKGGIECTDLVHYALPFGIIGKIAQVLFVEKQLEQIFEYRIKALDKLFT
jgi:ligand-binding SRPBCC domain-containing protein